ncbi:MAG: hypothetical protein KI792_02680 [Alphaproteobacteria bacterium]|nr:hypothetical protein [Alphaproteobacteria bacterium SS10]
MFAKQYAARDARASARQEASDRQDEVVLRTIGYITGARSMSSSPADTFTENAMKMRDDIAEVLRDQRKAGSPLPQGTQTLLQATHRELDGALKMEPKDGAASFSTFAKANYDTALEALGSGNEGYSARYQRDELAQKADTEYAGLIINGPLHRQMR